MSILKGLLVYPLAGALIESPDPVNGTRLTVDLRAVQERALWQVGQGAIPRI